MKKLILGLMLAALGANADLVDINGAKVERNTPYDIVDGESGTVGEFLDVGGFAMQTNVYDKSETDAKIDEKVSALDFYKKSEVDAKIADEGVKRQDGDTAAINSAKTYIDDKLKTYEASPNYAAVSNAAMTALQPAATNGLVTASVTNGLASAASVAQEAKDRAAAIAALTSASITNADPARVFEGKPGTMSERVIVSDGTTSLVLDENFITRHTKTDEGVVNHFYQFPSFDGTLALTTDIPAVPTKVSAFENDAGYLTAHQSLADYAKTTDVNAADASLFAYTTGVSNKVEAAQAAADANADAIAAETKAREDAGYLTAESDPEWAAWKTAETNIAIGVGAHAGDFDRRKQENIAPTNGSIAIGQNTYASYNGPAVAIGKEAFASWYAVTIGYGATNTSSSVAIGLRALAENGSSVALGTEASCRADFGGLSLGAYSDSSGELPTAVGAHSFSDEQGAALGVSSYAEDTGTAIGFESYAKKKAFGTRYNPDAFYFNSLKSDKGSTARTLQSYLDERATTNDLAAVKASVPVISATDATFSNAVLAVGIGTLGITTNDLQVVHDLAELPVVTSITTVGGLLAALATGLAVLKRKTASAIKASVSEDGETLVIETI